MDFDLAIKVRKYIVDFTKKKRSVLNAFALAALLIGYKAIH